jgi:hypothetical protein
MRILNKTNITALKTALLHTDWQPVYSDCEVHSSFDTFWTIFSALFSEHCPVTQIRFNKNKHRINAFMNGELLVNEILSYNCKKPTYPQNSKLTIKTIYSREINIILCLEKASKSTTLTT